MTKNKNIGYRIRRLRCAAEMKVEQLAVEIGVSVRTIARWEGGHSIPHHTFLEKIDRLFKGKK